MNEYHNEDGRFKSGNPGGGRPKGSKNKSNETIRKFFSNFIEDHLSDLNDAFEELEAKEKFKVLLDMAKYVIPAMRAQGDIVEELSDELFDEVVERIKQDYKLN